MDPTPDQQALLDPAALQAIRELDPDGRAGLLAQVVAMYLDASPALVRQIQAGIASGDANGVRIAAHTLKSSSANLGARRLAELSGALEHGAREGRVPAFADAGTRIEEEFEAVRRALARATGNTADA